MRTIPLRHHRDTTIPHFRHALLLVSFLSMPSYWTYANVVPAPLFADHMVLQRGVPIHIWGKAAPAETISVTFRDDTRTISADDIGLWSVYLPPASAGGPFELTVKGNNTVVLRDVMVGDVWVGSGQSNMEFALRDVLNGAAEVASADHPKIRLMHVARKVSSFPEADAEVRAWEVCSPRTAAGFSAVAYFFARELEGKLAIPIGLIDASWGGTPVEAWMSLRALSSSARFMPAFALWSQMNQDYSARMLRREKKVRDWQEADARAKAEGKAPPPPLSWEPNLENSWMPAGLYNAMIAPLTPYPIAGVIWYQGESNASPERAPLYAPMFQTMIRDWRSAWAIGEFPFLFVQLANFRTGPTDMWPEVREAQLQTLSIVNTAMAVTIDIGDPLDIHPRNKQEVGRRLALGARAIAYGEAIEYSGPIFRMAAPEGRAMRLWFDHAAGGLEARGGALKGFEIAGTDRKFVPADGRIENGTVVVSNTLIHQPAYVRYGWADSPECNLYNKEGLPASPFRTGE
jgi:sialate O-acetylesterase